MYSRPSSRDFRVPTNYGGSAFRDNTPTQAQDLTRRQQFREDEAPMRPSPDDARERQKEAFAPSLGGGQSERCENCPKAAEAKEHADPPRAEGTEKSLFSPLGALGSEEILLIALALIIFQSGKDPELALILLALPYIN